VLARGYAVCWADERSRVVRAASEVRAGDGVRVTLSEGELDCEVRAIHAARTEDDGESR
jgi:exonuclease VII large subunit